MAKKNGFYDPNDYDQRLENIRKAKGNPNKNVHRKKNGSNYGGVANAPAADRRAAAKQEEKMSPTVKASLYAMLALLLVVMVLQAFVFRNNYIMTQASTMVIGLICLFLAYINRYQRKKTGTFQTVMTVVLAGLGLLYALAGLLGLLKAFGL
ncbi:MAG: hypothetical protein E7426_02775 [Ruminococcaceae bacterium]|jgi:cation transport ATPase|nr:hypothetical protein [Oscillospiraceae bacterium]